MIRFKGRSSLKQHMPQKPIKHGYKVWIMANETGYVSKFQLYTGKISQEVEKCLGARDVKHLSSELTGKHHKLYFDNYFTSVPLMLDLKKQGIYACATVRKGRAGFPKDFENEKNMSRGEFQFRCSGQGITALVWKDRKPIQFLSNFHNIENMNTGSRKSKDGSRTEILCPDIVKDYNTYMGACR
ncbi:piggyBac transposable element-derived protein 2-like [Schistocerca serialis cubense]|uniref:piggyBac transposable element-derived protein 2-like n=1 Tax=Schistocerca serialis cubense TaxID=2023355 RepID=UPI00214EACDB|nr:piggyBac transposable element-derived protein 2-like [Schistocerca serialis cubense]